MAQNKNNKCSNGWCKYCVDGHCIIGENCSNGKVYTKFKKREDNGVLFMNPFAKMESDCTDCETL